MDATSIERLHLYHGELLKFNSKLNLISRNTERDADEAHFADCILAAQTLAKVDLGANVYDIGSGNGLPGLLMAILSPKTTFHLVESDVRKAEFLKHVAHTLQLGNATVLNVRVESLPAGSITNAVSRGFASVSKACVAVSKVMASGGVFYHLKGNSWSTEIAEIPSQLMSQWAPELIGEYVLPVSQARRAVVATRKKN